MAEPKPVLSGIVKFSLALILFLLMFWALMSLLKRFWGMA